ncbi:Alpha/beta hydrolase fold-1 [Dillenia turbinata]|uniref:Alpha/beta hydrolase fold-1 n=1 Tax=Dillenia turbinata TaxID=194707 RepID=A0AAN8UVW5_9MAGN
MEPMLGKAHFVLVHGSCHGAWSWYKLKPRLEAAGHPVMAVDLLASGVNLKAIEEVRTCDEYSKPLMEIVEHFPSKEKLVLVGHSSGGLSLALAMEKFPEKISVAVFLTAFMPDTVHRPSYVLEQETYSQLHIMPSEIDISIGALLTDLIKPHHFVLVHGLGHGAWCWYKIIALLESSGHHVTAIDLGASGTDPRAIQEIHTFARCNEPLTNIMASIPADEKVILVGHSLGGMILAFAMQQFTDKILVAVFLTALLPDTVHSPAYVMEQHIAMGHGPASFLDSQFIPYGDLLEMNTAILFDPKFLKTYLYNESPVEDYTPATTLVRPGNPFTADLAKAPHFTNGGFRSVPRVFIVCTKDKSIPEPFQLFMINNTGVNHVLQIDGADHMAMLSKPQ